MPHRLNARAPTDCQTCGWRPQHMFCNLSADVLADFSAIGCSLRLAPGSVLFHEGDHSDRIYVLCEGKVKLSCTSKEGKTLNLRIAFGGDVLGLSGVISSSTFEITAEALGPLSVKVIPRSDFMSFLERHGEASMHAAKALADEYKAAYSEARRLALSSTVGGRLAGLLLDWGRSATCGRADACNDPTSQSGMRFNMALTHEDLAGFTGCSRETITRALGKMQKDQLIEVRGVSVRILAPEKLAAMAV